MSDTVLLREKIPQGATWKRRYTWKIGDDIVDLTGYSARMQIRDSYESSSPAISLTSTAGIIILPGQVQWHIAITLTEEQTRGLVIQAGGAVSYPQKAIKVGDLELIAPNGEVKRFIDYVFTVTREVTR